MRERESPGACTYDETCSVVLVNYNAFGGSIRLLLNTLLVWSFDFKLTKRKKED